MVNDQDKAEDVTITMQLLDFGADVKWEEKFIESLGGRSQDHSQVSCKRSLPSPNEVFLHLELEGDGLYHYNDHLGSTRDVIYRKSVDAMLGKSMGFSGRGVSDVPAFFLTLNAGGISGEFGNNCFTLLPKNPRTLIFRLNRGPSARV